MLRHLAIGFLLILGLAGCQQELDPAPSVAIRSVPWAADAGESATFATQCSGASCATDDSGSNGPPVRSSLFYDGASDESGE